MRRIVMGILVIVLVSMPLAAYAEDLLVVMSLRSSGYSEVVDAARKTCNVSFREIYLNEATDIDLARIVRESRAKVVLAVGDKALRMATASLPRTPVIGVLTLETQPAGRNVKSISYLAKPEKYMALMQQLGRRKVGVVYGGQMAPYIKKAEKIASDYNILLEKRPISGPPEVISALASLVGQVDALWILPDSSVLTQATIEDLFNFAKATNVPAIVFSKNYLKVGAAVALEPERSSMGTQAGTFICETVGVAPKGSLATNSNPMYSIQSNYTVLNKLGIPVP